MSCFLAVQASRVLQAKLASLVLLEAQVLLATPGSQATLASPVPLDSPDLRAALASPVRCLQESQVLPMLWHACKRVHCFGK